MTQKNRQGLESRIRIDHDNEIGLDRGLRGVTCDRSHPRLGGRPAAADHKAVSQAKRSTSATWGSFFIGGVPKVTLYAASNSPTAARYEQITIGQMYVQFMIPHNAKTWPLIMLHGGMYTGAHLESTDDGREGWMPYGDAKGDPVLRS